jgi:hypothetical protein
VIDTRGVLPHGTIGNQCIVEALVIPAAKVIVM